MIRSRCRFDRDCKHDEINKGTTPPKPPVLFCWREAPAERFGASCMSTRRWTITTHHTGKPRDVDVVLYDKLAHMRSAATRHDRTVGSEPQSYAHTVGVCHGFDRILVHDDGTEVDDQLAVILRFTSGYLTPTILSHEVAHAAQHLYLLDCLEGDDSARDHFSAGNERFAHLLGDLFEAVWFLFHDPVEVPNA